MNKLMTGAALLTATLMLSGCGDKSSTTTPDATPSGGSTPSGKVIGVTMMDLGNPFFGELSQSIKDEAAKHGFDVQILSGDNGDKQANQVRDMIAKGVSAIVISPNDHYGIGEAIRLANVAKIPVFTADTGCSDTNAIVQCNITTDNFGGGVLAGQAIIEALDKKGGEVLILSYDTAQSCIDRVKGCVQAIDAWNKENPTAMVNVAATLPGKADQEASKLATEDALGAHPNIRAVFAINDPSALGAVVAIEAAKKQDTIKVVGFDGQMMGKIAIRDGRLFADPIQFPKKIGKITVDQIIAVFNGDEVKKEILIDTKLYYKADAMADPELKDQK